MAAEPARHPRRQVPIGAIAVGVALILATVAVGVIGGGSSASNTPTAPNGAPLGTPIPATTPKPPVGIPLSGTVTRVPNAVAAPTPRRAQPSTRRRRSRALAGAKARQSLLK